MKYIGNNRPDAVPNKLKPPHHHDIVPPPPPIHENLLQLDRHDEELMTRLFGDGEAASNAWKIISTAPPEIQTSFFLQLKLWEEICFVNDQKARGMSDEE